MFVWRLKIRILPGGKGKNGEILVRIWLVQIARVRRIQVFRFVFKRESMVFCQTGSKI